MNRPKGFDLIVYLSDDWEKETARGIEVFHLQALFKALAQIVVNNDGKMLCVNRPITPIAGLVRKPRKILRALRTGQNLQKVTDYCYVYTPISFIHDMIAAFLPGAKEINRALLSRQIRTTLRRLSFDASKRVSWIHHPMQLAYLRLAEETFSIYYCYDDYSNWPGRRKFYSNKIRHFEQKVLNEADLVFCISQRLLEQRAKGNF